VTRTASGEHGEAARDGPATDAETRDVRATVEAVRDGDRDAFGRLVTRYQRRLFGLTLMMVRQPAAAEEVTQDAFVRAFACLDRYDAHRPFYPWLSTIAVRLAQSWLRRHGRKDTGPDDRPALDRATSEHQLDDLVTDERDRRLWRAVAALSSGERTAVMLYYRQEMKVREIAHALGVTSGTVKTLLFRARRHLRRKLDDAGWSGRS
jgi:RNA polymerase sigma-70 factor (ECF subfamily)